MIVFLYDFYLRQGFSDAVGDCLTKVRVSLTSGSAGLIAAPCVQNIIFRKALQRFFVNHTPQLKR